MQYRKNFKPVNEPGHAHALTFSCFRRQAFLCKDRSRKWLVDAIDRARQLHRWHVWGYVIMPEHAHVLMWPVDPIYDVSQLLNSIKQSVAKRAILYLRREAPSFLAKLEDRQPNKATSHRFWQRGGGYDRNVITVESARDQLIYFHNNPVRRGLCARPEDWVWSSAADLMGLRPGPLSIDKESIPQFFGLP